MRIIHIVPKPPYQGGLETFAGQLCEQLVEQRHDVTWYCLNKLLRNKSKKRSKNGIIIKEFKPLFDDPFYIPSRNFLTELKQEDADIIHIHNLHTLLPLVLVVFAKGLQARIVLQPHYHVQGQSFVRNIFFCVYKKLMKLIIRHFNVIVVNSKFEQSAFIRDFPEVSYRVMLIPEELSLGIPQNMMWNPVKHPKKILYVGVLKKYKNVDMIIHAFKMLVPKISDLELTIVGKGAQKEELVKLAANLGVDDGITWKSDLTYNELLKEYSEASVVVHLSELESFSRVVHEAMAIGTPLVVYDYGVLGALVNEGLAKGVKSLDAAKIADAIDAVIKNQWKPNSHSLSVKSESYVGTIEKLYQNLLPKPITQKHSKHINASLQNSTTVPCV
jgi:glycosyltransferase involved in cell wall biosynthesis